MSEGRWVLLPLLLVLWAAHMRYESTILGKYTIAPHSVYKTKNRDRHTIDYTLSL
jgi:hypothetical protein